MIHNNLTIFREKPHRPELAFMQILFSAGGIEFGDRWLFNFLFIYLFYCLYKIHLQLEEF